MASKGNYSGNNPYAYSPQYVSQQNIQWKDVDLIGKAFDQINKEKEQGLKQAELLYAYDKLASDDALARDKLAAMMDDAAKGRELQGKNDALAWAKFNHQKGLDLMDEAAFVWAEKTRSHIINDPNRNSKRDSDFTKMNYSQKVEALKESGAPAHLLNNNYFMKNFDKYFRNNTQTDMKESVSAQEFNNKYRGNNNSSKQKPIQDLNNVEGDRYSVND